MLTAVGVMSEDQLAEAVRRGYVAAFRWLRSAEDAQDACQEAARRAWSARARYDDTRPLYPWFYRILKNHCLDRLARRRAAPPVATDAEAVSGDPSAEQVALERERAQTIEAAIGQLPEDFAAVIELRHFQDATYEEMAEVLDCPVGTVMSRLYRARKRLRALLSQAEDADGGRRE